MWEKSMTVAGLDPVRDVFPLAGVCTDNCTVGVLGGLHSTVLLRRLGRVASTLSSHWLYNSSSYCFMDRATARYLRLAYKKE